MGADRTLVNAAFREARSRAGASGDIPGVIDRSSQYQSSIDISRQSLGLISNAMTNLKVKVEKNRIGMEKQLDIFKDAARLGLKKLYALKEPMREEVIFAVEEKVKSLQAEYEKYNTYGKKDTSENEKARIKLEASLQRVINEAINVRGDFMKVGNNVDNWNTAGVTQPNIAPMTQVMNFVSGKGEHGGTTVDFSDDGRLTFTTDDGQDGFISMNSGDMLGWVPAIDTGFDTNVHNPTLKNTIDQAKKDDGVSNFNSDGVKAKYSRVITSKEDWNNVYSRVIGETGDLSFKDSLLDDPNIPLSVIENMFYKDDETKTMHPEYEDLYNYFKKLDEEGVTDGEFTSADAEGLEGDKLTEFEQNVLAMQDALTNVENPAFVLSTSVDLFADYNTKINEHEYNKIIDKNIQDKKTAQQKAFDKAEKERLANLPPQTPSTYKNKKVEDMVHPWKDQPKFSMWSDDIIKLQNRLSDVMESGKLNQIVPVRDQMYQWGGTKEGWRKVEKKEDGSYYFIDDDGNKIWKKDARTYPTLQKVFDEQGILFQGNTSSKKTFNVGEIYPMGGKNYEYLESGGFKEIVESKTLKFKDMPGDMKEILLPKHTGGDKAKADKKNKKYLAEYLKEDDTASWAEFDSWMEGK
jgi:hypothetical protein